LNISSFNKCRILVIGDLMIDEYVWGAVDRISPEAPVPIVTVEREDYTLGGAGNVVNNLAALGGQVSAAGVIGTGGDGVRLMTLFKRLGVDADGVIREPGRPTTRKTRIIAAHQHVLRIDRETRREVSADTVNRLTAFTDRKIPEIDVILISDYAKGLLTRSLLKKLTTDARSHNKPIIADPKGMDFSKYAGVTLLTPNRKEAALAAGIEITDEASLIRAGRIILEKSGIENLLITCGKDGMVLFEQDKRPHAIHAEARQVFDVSGAGDTVLSVFSLALASGCDFQEAAAVANTAAGIVVGKLGTATVSQEELAEALKRG
jgi:D-beta-D-heptose 7-phosphate kinase/D-beta-D-heptose 1-phosphate adenosyltransferase